MSCHWAMTGGVYVLGALPPGERLAFEEHLSGCVECTATVRELAGLPGLLSLPVLGTLFRSRDFVNNQTELMVLVTPYIVRAVAQKDLSRPDDGFAEASDPQTVLLGNLTRIYGVPPRANRDLTYRGKYGFITD